MTTKHCVYLKVKRLFIVSCLLSLVDLFVCIFYMDIITYKCLPCHALPCFVMYRFFYYSFFEFYTLTMKTTTTTITTTKSDIKSHSRRNITSYIWVLQIRQKKNILFILFAQWSDEISEKIPKRWNDQRTQCTERILSALICPLNHMNVMLCMRVIFVTPCVPFIHLNQVKWDFYWIFPTNK